MNRKFWLLAFVAVVLLSAGPVLADDGFYVIGVGGKPVGTAITSLPCTINESGMYYLDRNLQILLNSGSAITVSASNVTLDLMGFTLNGGNRTSGSAHGIWINAGIFGVEVRNGCIFNFAGDGVHCLGTNCRIMGLRVTNVGAAGISENGQNQVISCFASSCGHEGIYSGGASMLKGNTVNGNATYGINVVDACTIVGNSVQNNVNNGINAGLGSLVQGNQVSGNSGNGIIIANGSMAMGNAVYKNSGPYAGISASPYCSVTDNIVYLNIGVEIVTSDHCTITRNTSDGLIGGLTYCTITNNTAYNVLGGDHCTLADNTGIYTP